jgi:hypothetical protein
VSSQKLTGSVQFAKAAKAAIDLMTKMNHDGTLGFGMRLEPLEIAGPLELVVVWLWSRK